MVSNLLGNSKCGGDENFCVWNFPGGRGGRFSASEGAERGPFSEPMGLGAGGTR